MAGKNMLVVVVVEGGSGQYILYSDDPIDAKWTFGLTLRDVTY